MKDLDISIFIQEFEESFETEEKALKNLEKAFQKPSFLAFELKNNNKKSQK